MSRRAVVPISRLDDHPNLTEILGVLAQLGHIRDADLQSLAQAWVNNADVAAARDRALSPDSPLVLEVLAAFEAVAAVFDDDLRGEAAYITVEPSVTSTALKAVRDAIAGSYAQPALDRAAYQALMAPWRAVYPADTIGEPDLGPEGDRLRSLLSALPRLSTRCHDQAGRELFETLVDRSFAGESDRAEAREAAFQAAVITSRRRIWTLVRRSGAEGLLRSCPTCGPSAPDLDEQRSVERVLGLCLDAACALLVADALPDATTTLLLDPVARLIPPQRAPSS
ncbi:MAG: hypothetical protein M3N21_05275 [Actinomycetota bacterium]|nr:hypothetical protein [Actinomycetota bacterium]